MVNEQGVKLMALASHEIVCDYKKNAANDADSEGHASKALSADKRTEAACVAAAGGIVYR